MKKANLGLMHLCLATTVTALVGCGGSVETNTDTTQIDTSAPVSDWQLVWSDEFDGTGIDSSKWNFEVDCAGGGNNEQQCYTDSSDNAFLKGGSLNIVALPAEEGAEKPYTSARLNTRYKGDFKYGRIEMRAKMPSGQGSWPAFWMMPTDEVYGGWPRSGEIDIVEAVNLKAAREDGSAESHVYGTLHYGKAWPANSQSGKAYLPETNPADDYHTYAIEWQEGEIRWYMDGYLYATQRRSELKRNGEGVPTGLKHKGWFSEYYDQGTGELTTFWDNSPYDQEFYLILNLAVGGSWPESVNETGVNADAFANGQTFAIDYVRVYECAQDPLTGKGCETVRPGYDSLDDALVEGAAPEPPKPSSGEPEPVTMFYADELAADLSFDSYNPDGVVSHQEVEEAGRGTVLEVVKAGAVGNFFFNAAQPYDLTPYGTVGELVFDVRIDSAVAGAELLVKLDSGWPNVSDMTVDAQADGTWRTIRINIAELIAAGNRFAAGSQADQGNIVNVFVVEPTAEMTFRLDNVRLEYPSGSKTTSLYEDALASDLAFDSYNPDGAVSFSEVDEDGRGKVIAMNKNGANGNMYFTASAPYDMTEYGEYGELIFDLYLESMDAGVELLIKLDSGWPNVSDVSVTLPPLAEWTEVRLNIAEILASENRYSPGSFAIPEEVVNVFVVEPTGAMSLKIDNVRFEAPPAPEVTTFYADALSSDVVYNSYNPEGAVSYQEVEEADRGMVLEVTKAGAVGNLYFEALSPYDISDYGASSELVFDVKVESLDAASELLIKIDSGWPNVSDVAVTLPETGTWGTIKLNIADLIANGNRFSPGSQADPENVTNPFVIEPTGAMVVKFDNVRYVKR